MDSQEDLKSLLPSLTRNKNYVKRLKYKEKKREIEESREWSGKRKLLKAKKAVAKSVANDGKATPKKSSKKENAEPAKKKLAAKSTKPVTVVANAPTGRETLVKKRARELVQKKNQEKRATAKKTAQKQKMKKSLAVAAAKDIATDERDKVEGVPMPTPPAEELERLLIERTIRGGVGAEPVSVVREDQTLYPDDVAFFDDYAEQKRTEAISEDQLLANAHQYFQELGRKERRINQIAARHLKEMREVNRRGGDKDGFRYVLPKNVKEVVHQMMSNSNNNATSFDPDMLVSTFGGDPVQETSDKPMRRRRNRTSTYSDFYQFQVSKRWTRNAESFLNRGRAIKSLFEAKKRQRSIRKL